MERKIGRGREWKRRKEMSGWKRRGEKIRKGGGWDEREGREEEEEGCKGRTE